ncbi:MBL fold metallo-hydrolase [Pseudonocardia endophytica]|uniref:Glyoxylase-like metal-dependent hydrolase (Beta-lactamase superfamily II) n=1 Tax=Pseudonocardia endophytica TaxID=401976 RepID=A0A4R1HL09_PSEEN|nr:MBL fold metallo-hydrolase [Pseudonocardia endophytica]TCK20980.1 glyoxylase-like metal-dependent hydrolase (beta-lactamase superfamily II) [Pseudonocardia endophytica]
MDGRWVEVGDRVLARRHDELDLTTGLVIGDDRALVIDTRGDERQGREWFAAVREVTALPLVVVITHAHFDHCFGTSAFAGSPVVAQAGCAAEIAATAAAQRAEWTAYYRERGDDVTARALAATDPPLPDHPVCPRPGDRYELDLGARTAVVVHPGPGHTGHDLAVHVPDAGVLFAGDLLENGAPPSYGPDSFPGEWANAVGAFLDEHVETLVPGHGEPMSSEQAAAQHDELAEVARLFHGVADGELDRDAADRLSPHPGVGWPH